MGLQHTRFRSAFDDPPIIEQMPYLRSLLCYEVTRDGRGPVRIRLWSDWQEYQRLITRYFGLRILITDHAEWSTAQIIEAYRGQSKVEPRFAI